MGFLRHIFIIKVPNVYFNCLCLSHFWWTVRGPTPTVIAMTHWETMLSCTKAINITEIDGTKDIFRLLCLLKRISSNCFNITKVVLIQKYPKLHQCDMRCWDTESINKIINNIIFLLLFKLKGNNTSTPNKCGVGSNDFVYKLWGGCLS